MEPALVFFVLLAVVAYFVVPTVLTRLEAERRRRQLAREALLADLRLRQVAQAGLRQMLEEARRDVG